MHRIFLAAAACVLCLVLPARAQEVLTWEGCLAEAKKNHPDLISAQAGVAQQKASKWVSVSEWFPQVGVSADAGRSKSNKIISNSYSYGLTGSQLIFDGFKTLNTVKAAGESVSAAQQNYRFVSSQVRFNLRAAFINVMKAQALIRVTEEIAAIRRGNLELITLRYQSGLEHRGALLTAEANMAEAAFEISQAKRDLTLAQRQVDREMGRTQFLPMSVKEDFSVRPLPAEKPDFDALVKDNPSLLQSAAKKNAAAYGIRTAYGNFAPQVTGQAGADRSGKKWPPQDNAWNVGVGVSMPLFEGGLRTAEVSQANAAYEQAQANESSLRGSLIVTLEQSWAALQDALEAVGVQRKSLAAAEERSRIAESQYSLGLIQYDSWTIIEDALVGAKKNFLNAQANLMLAEASWIQAKGETLEYAD